MARVGSSVYDGDFGIRYRTHTPYLHPSTTAFNLQKFYRQGKCELMLKFICVSQLLPDRFDGDVAVQPDDWLQGAALYKEACGLSDAQLF